VVSFTPRLLYTQRKNIGIGSWVGHGTGLNDVETRIISPLQGLELRYFGRPARSQSLYLLRYPGSYLRIRYRLNNLPGYHTLRSDILNQVPGYTRRLGERSCALPRVPNLEIMRQIPESVVGRENLSSSAQHIAPLMARHGS
jgi:hypothetical protein